MSDYWQDVAEFDFILWELQQMLSQQRSLDAFARMVDEATGFEAQKLRAAKRLIRRARALKRRIDEATLVTGGEQDMTSDE